MSQPAADRNLLFGMLALQMDFIKRDQLITAMQAWVFDKGKPLGEILCAQKALAKDNHALLEALVQRHLAMHDNNLEKSLAAVSSVGSVKEDLAFIRDPEVQASLGHVNPASATDIDIYATVAPPTAGATHTGKEHAPTMTGSSTGEMRFRILRPHARGGLGEVFVARDSELNREVALKEIQDRQADNLDSRSRFMLEAEITGGLEHPGIVPVYGLGTYADGRPYYAMRFIRGDSLKEAIERFHKADALGMAPGQRSLELRELLRRFIDVCNAIAYAHSRGVLHRDLKPGNVMLGKYGETLVVDWGLAKPLGAAVAQDRQGGQAPQPGDGSLIPSSLGSASETLFGSAVGTPQYMSPEQAAGQLDQIGPGSDVYSLGATLFCLLTGQPPVEGADVGEILRKVLCGKLRKPTEIKKDMSLPLEAICMKAMTFKISDRYASPRLLADDIEHWLADEPVSAWPEPWTVKARRWVARHRTLVTSVAAAVIVAVVGLTAATVLLTAANERERKAKEFALEQEAIAKQNFQMARSAVDGYYTNVSENTLLNEPGMQPLRRKLLQDAKDYYEKFIKERANDKGIQGELGKATYRLAQITGDLGSELDAIKLHQKAVKHFETLAAAEATPDLQSDLAGTFHHLGRLYRLTDQIDQSEESYRKALTLWERLVKDQPKEARFQSALARTQLGLGNVNQLTRHLDEAQKMYQQALANWSALADANPKTAEYRRDLAVSQNNLAMTYLAIAGKEQEAQKGLRSSLAIQKRLADEAPNIGQYQSDLAKTHFNLGEYQEAANLWRDLVAKHPAVTEGHKTLAEAHAALALVHRHENELKKAEDASQRALKIKRKLVDEHLGVPSYQGDLARGLYALGEVLRADSQFAVAEKTYQEGAAIQEKLARDLPRAPHYQAELARSYNGLGLLHQADKKDDKASAAYNKSLAVWTTLMKEHPAELEFAQGHAVACVNLGTMSNFVSNPKGAIDWYTRAVEGFDAKNPRTLESRQVKNTLMNAHRLRAETLTKEGRHQESLQDWDRVLELAAPVQKLPVRLLRATTMARAGKYMDATREASDMLQSQKKVNGDTLYRFACLYALSVPSTMSDGQRPVDEREELAEQFAAEAVRLLGAAAEEKFFKTPASRERLKTDPDLQAVRARPDFAKMASELKGN